MELLDPFLQIKTIYNTFTVSYKKLADFVLQNPEFVLDNSILDVAVTCNVAEATVSRFCRLLGYKGYLDFKVSIAQSLAKNGRNHLLGAQITEEDSILATAQLLLAKNIQALNETNQLITEESITKAVNLLVAANRIMFLGIGSSLVSVLQGYSKFVRVTPKACINLESHMQFMAASLLSKDDVALIVSHSGSTKEIVDIAKKAKEHGAKVICITHYQKSPLTDYSDVSLLYSSDEQLVYGYSVSGTAAQNYLMDLLYIGFFKSNQETYRENQEESSSLLLDKLY